MEEHWTNGYLMFEWGNATGLHFLCFGIDFFAGFPHINNLNALFPHVNLFCWSIAFPLVMDVMHAHAWTNICLPFDPYCHYQIFFWCKIDDALLSTVSNVSMMSSHGHYLNALITSAIIFIENFLRTYILYSSRGFQIMYTKFMNATYFMSGL